mgnify:CR=1 FL=1
MSTKLSSVYSKNLSEPHSSLDIHRLVTNSLATGAQKSTTFNLMSNDADEPKKPRGTFAWALWDWAEQPFPTIFSTFIFLIHITSAAFVPEAVTSRALGLPATIVGHAVAIVPSLF